MFAYCIISLECNKEVIMPAAVQKVTNLNTAKPAPKEKEKKKYSDPLNNWGLRAMSYTNEIGTTVYEIAPKVTFALWIPTFMYLGADIYDKYKNDKNHYAPSAKRGVENAISQGISSFLLPTLAILIGQKSASPIGVLFKDKLTINAKDTLIRHSKDVIDQAISERFDNKDKFKEMLKNSLENKIQARKREKHTYNIFNRIHKSLRGDYSITTADKSRLNTYAGKLADDLFEIKSALLQGKKPSKISNRIFKRYLETTPIMKKMYGDDYTNQALKTAMKDYLNSLIVKNKLTKTLGGLISLILLIKPIDIFVDKIIMPKYIEPGIDIVSEKLAESNKMRLHVKSFNDYHPKKALNGNEKKSEIYLKFLGFFQKESQVNQEHNSHPQVLKSHSAQEKTI